MAATDYQTLDAAMLDEYMLDGVFVDHVSIGIGNISSETASGSPYIQAQIALAGILSGEISGLPNILFWITASKLGSVLVYPRESVVSVGGGFADEAYRSVLVGYENRVIKVENTSANEVAEIMVEA